MRTSALLAVLASGLLAACAPAPAASPDPAEAGAPSRLSAPVAGGGEYRQSGGTPLLLAFVDPREPGSRSQIVVLRSMATQYGDRGLDVVLVAPRTGGDDLVNLRHDWNLDSVGVVLLNPPAPAELATRYAATALPTTVLIGPDGAVAHRWAAAAVPAQDIALPLQSLLATPS